MRENDKEHWIYIFIKWFYICIKFSQSQVHFRNHIESNSLLEGGEWNLSSNQKVDYILWRTAYLSVCRFKLMNSNIFTHGEIKHFYMYFTTIKDIKKA